MSAPREVALGLGAYGSYLDLALLGVVTHRVFAFWLPVVPGSILALTLTRLRTERVAAAN